MTPKQERPGYWTLEAIAGTTASEYLARNTKLNRNQSQSRIDEMSETILAGEWLLTHQGIAFDPDGTLLDGQHRMAAIVKASKTNPSISVQMWVYRGLPRPAMLPCDTGGGRKPGDACKMEEIPLINARSVPAVAKRMMLSVNASGKIRRKQFIDFITQHREAIEFSLQNSSSKVLGSNAAVRAPIARAWYTRDRARLGHFVDSIKTGVVSCDEDSAAAALMRLLVKLSKSPKDQAWYASVYRSTSTALKAFLEHRPLQSIRPTDYELFPLPGED